VAESLRKLGLYFQGADAYWQLSNGSVHPTVDVGPLGRYPVDLIPRLTSGHFCHFDDAGLPVRFSRDGHGYLHNYTTIAAYALAHWDSYLVTGDQEHIEPLLRAADYILRTAERSPENIIRLRTEHTGKGHCGALSAMFQGEAISVLCRAWQATKQDRYLDAALECVPPFELPIEKEGVLGHVSRLNIPWYEEYPAQPGDHVLNGMIYALWGLRDLALVVDQPRARRLFETGVSSIVAALPLFDSGFWSWYWISEEGRPYIASMMYHNLHTCQLTALARQTGATELAAWAGRFRGYAGSAICRLRAAASMVGARVRAR
jgi:heparosan-N-sulfate-glucuronate 5-epimerase